MKDITGYLIVFVVGFVFGFITGAGQQDTIKDELSVLREEMK